MIERPSTKWHRAVQEQAAAVAAGTLAPDEAYAARLWPTGFISEVDAAFETYEAEVRDGAALTDEQILGAVERVVETLNDINVTHGAIETGEREDLCEYIDVVLMRAGVDVGALTDRHDIERNELAGEWRDW